MQLPLLRTAPLVISAVYTLRGLHVIPGLTAQSRGIEFPSRFLAFSAVSLAAGLSHLVGVATAWRALSRRAELDRHARPLHDGSVSL